VATENSSDDFASLFEQQPAAKTGRALHVGDRLEVNVVRVGKSAVFVELDGKRQGFFESTDLLDDSGQLSVDVGDKVTGHIVEMQEAQGMFRLARTMGRTHGVEGLEQAKAAGLPVEGKVAGVNKGGFEVDVGGVRAFCPLGQIDARFVQDPSTFVGQTLSFLVREIKDNGRSVTLSRRILLEREAQEAYAKVAETIVPGATLRGTVTSVRDFGAFVDLGGIEGMIPRSELGHDRSVATADVLKPGESVEVLVREVKDAPAPEARRGRGKPGPNLRITLSLRALMADPWDAQSFEDGQVLLGKVVRVQPFGAFVQIAPGVDGLLHVSEMNKEHPFAEGADVVVVVKKLDRQAKKVSLGLAPEGAQPGSSVQVGLRPQPPRRPIAINAIVEGVIEKIETFGLFVQIDGTVGRSGRGLVPNVETGLPRGSDLRKAFPVGSRVTVKVLETGEGKIRLSVRGAKDAEERAQYEQARDSMQRNPSFGSLGDLLKKSQAKKKR
jgi:small subunit ribosomal protein S1